MRDEIVLRPFLVFLKGIVENGLKVRRGCFWEHLGHRGSGKETIRAESTMVMWGKGGEIQC